MLEDNQYDEGQQQTGCCELCHRAMIVTKHHLIPRTRHKNKRNKRLFDRDEVKHRVAWLCRPCHNHVHNMLTNKQLELEYNTLESLATHPEIAKFAQWISNKPTGLKV